MGRMAVLYIFAKLFNVQLNGFSCLGAHIYFYIYFGARCYFS